MSIFTRVTRKGAEDYFSATVASTQPESATLEIAKAINENRISDLFSQHLDCQNDMSPMGECAFSLGDLFECSCAPLSRKLNKARLKYEENFIGKFLEKAKSATDIKITDFATGYLLSDLVLLAKALQAANNAGWKGRVTVNLIDLQYKAVDPTTELNTPMICGGFLLTAACFSLLSKNKEVKKAAIIAGVVGVMLIMYGMSRNKKEVRKIEFVDPIATKAAAQFIKTIGQILPETIQLKLRFFASTESYINLCKINPKCQSDILTGSDIDDTWNVVEKLRVNTLKSDGSRALLLKLGDKGGLVE